MRAWLLLLAGAELACVAPEAWQWPEDQGLQSFVLVDPTAFELVTGIAARAADGPVPINTAADFRLLGYPYTLEELQLQGGRRFDGTLAFCGGMGRQLPPPAYVFALDGQALVLRPEESYRVRVDGFSVGDCVRAGRQVSSQDGALLCQTSTSALEAPAAPVPPTEGAWPEGCTGFEDCVPDLPGCPVGQYRLGRDKDCAPIVDCASASWPAEVSVYIDPAAAAGGDGTLAHPFRTIAEARPDHAGEVFGLLPGTHPLDVMGRLRLLGLCPEQSRLLLRDRQLAATATTTLARLAVELDGPLFLAGALQLREVELVATTTAARVQVGPQGRLDAEGLGMTGFGTALAVGGSAVVRSAAIVDFDTRAIVATAGSQLTLEGAYFSPRRVSRLGSLLTLQLIKTTAKLRDLRLDGYAATGISVDGGALLAEDLVINGPSAPDSSLGAIVLRCTDGSDRKLERVLVQGATHFGVQLSPSDPTTECPPAAGATIIRDLHTTATTVGRRDDADSAGLSIAGMENVTVERFHSFQDPRGLAFGLRRVQANLGDIWVQAPIAPDTALVGAVRLECPDCDLNVQRVLVEDAYAGLSVGLGRTNVRDATVRGGSFGFLLGDQFSESGAMTSVVGERWASIDAASAVQLRGGTHRLRGLQVIGADLGLIVYGAVRLDATVENFDVEAAESYRTLTSSGRIQLRGGRFRGPGAAASLACAADRFVLDRVAAGP